MKELTLQRRIIDAAKQAGGWGSKWATQMQAGRPDLILCLPQTGLFVAEVKVMKDLPDGWNRCLKVTKIQRENLRAIAKAGGLGILLVLTVERRTNNKWLNALRWDFEALSERECNGGGIAAELLRSGKSIDLPGLMGRYFQLNKGLN